jgi:hypothetical protein
MNIAYIESLTQRAAAGERIADADIEALRRSGVDCEDAAAGFALAAAILELDRVSAASSPRWTGFFVESLVDLLVWDERPTGVVDAACADWLLARIAPDGGRPADHHRLLLAALVREAQHCDPRIAAAAFGYDRRPAMAPVALVAALEPARLTA